MFTKQLFKKTLLFSIAVLGVSTLVSLVVGEFIVKHVLPQQTYGQARAVGLNIFYESPLLPYTLKKNVNRFLHIAFTREFTHYVSTNSHGLRGKEFSQQKSADTYRILFLGDSITFGWGVEDTEAYPVIVEHYLNQSLNKDKYQRVEVLNAGFTDANSLDTFYLYYKEIGNKYDPDLVIVNFHPPNDIYDMYYHKWDTIDEQNYPLTISSKTHIVKDGYLVSRKKTKWKYEIPFIRNLHVGILFLNALETGAPKIVEKIKAVLNIEEETEAFNLEQNYECLYSIEQSKCPEVLWPYIETSKNMFTGIKKLAEANQDEFVVTLMPGSHQIIPLSENAGKSELIQSINPQTFYREFFADKKFLYFDLTPALIEQNAKGLFYALDGHINKQGHEVVAKAIVAFLQKTKPDLFLPK